METVLPDGTTGGANSELSDEAETDVASDIIEDEVSVDETSSLVFSFSFVCVDSPLI